MADEELTSGEELLTRIRRRTPARVLVGRCGGGYPTKSLLQLRQAHAAAKDAVLADFDPSTAVPSGCFTATTLASHNEEYLLRPDLGRRLSDDSRREIKARFPLRAQLQIFVGDGLSSPAVTAQVPALLPLLISGAQQRGWSVGQVFAVRYCRVGVMNDIGELLAPDVVVLLIGERPGLATAESLSAYMAFQPRVGNTDADRNLVSNIHARGTSPDQAAMRILNLAAQMMAARVSGTTLKEATPSVLNGRKPAK